MATCGFCYSDKETLRANRYRVLNRYVLKALSVGSGLLWLVILGLGFLIWRKRGGNEFERRKEKRTIRVFTVKEMGKYIIKKVVSKIL